MAEYKITGVTVEVRPGILLTAEISSLAHLKQLIADLGEENFVKATPAGKTRGVDSGRPGPSVEGSPSSHIETRAGLASGKLAATKVLAFKDGDAQLLRPGAFSSVSDATLALLYAVEIGLKKPSIPYDEFKDLYDAQNIKSGSALPTLLTNLRSAGYVDKRVYAADRTVRLTAKGAAKAEDVLKALCGS